MKKLPVHRIIPFSNVDGEGNRTAIFLQGCNLNCLYCHNRELIPFTHKAVVNMGIDELVEKIKDNMPFIRGITVSGGEATLYASLVVDLFKRVKPLGITCYVDTNGFFDNHRIQELIDVTDKFLFDIKGNPDQIETLCFSNRWLKQGENKKNLVNPYRNLDELLKKNKIEEVRLVYIKNYYDAKQTVQEIAKHLKPYPLVPLKIIKVHNHGLQEEVKQVLEENMPTDTETKKLASFAYAQGINQIKFIL